MIDKKKNDKLVCIADKVLQTSSILNSGSIKDSYNGSIAAFSVSIALSGLCPTLTIYFHKDDRRNILDVLVKMLTDKENGYYTFDKNVCKCNSTTPIMVNNTRGMLEYAFYCNECQRKKLKSEIVACAIALKQVVRTYNLIKDGEN